MSREHSDEIKNLAYFTELDAELSPPLHGYLVPDDILAVPKSPDAYLADGQLPVKDNPNKKKALLIGGAVLASCAVVGIITSYALRHHRDFQGWNNQD